MKTRRIARSGEDLGAVQQLQNLVLSNEMIKVELPP